MGGSEASGRQSERAFTNGDFKLQAWHLNLLVEETLLGASDSPHLALLLELQDAGFKVPSRGSPLGTTNLQSPLWKPRPPQPH